MFTAADMLITKYNNDEWMKGVIVSRVGKVRRQNGNSEETRRKKNNLYTRGKACNTISRICQRVEPFVVIPGPEGVEYEPVPKETSTFYRI